MIKLKEKKAFFYILLLGIILYIPFLGGMHLFDWDEINFAESAREMIVSGNYLDVQINYMPFWEKPPLFIWMQVLSMKIFGINEFAARFPNAVCGIITLLILYHTGRNFRDEKFGWIWVMTYTCSILPFFYFKFGIIDPWYNLFIFLGLINFVYYLVNKEFRTKNLVLSALFIGLAILTKGPVALLIFILTFTIYLLFVRFRIKTSIKDVFIFITVLSISGGFWFILQVFSGNTEIIRDFIIYQLRLFKTEDAGHGGFLMYHFVVLFFGVFPASVFAVFSFFKKTVNRNGNSGFALWMQILFCVVIILFSIVNTKIVHYSSMCYFPITFLASVTIWKIYSGEINSLKWIRVLLTFSSIIIGLLVITISLIDYLKDWIISEGFIRDGFTLGNLQASGKWTKLEPVIGILFILISGFFIWNSGKNFSFSVKGIFATSLVFVFFIMTFITPRVEAYSQRAAIEFYKEVATKDAYLATLGFKSYAHLFYGQVKPPVNLSVNQKEWLLKGEIDKKTYIVFKINRKNRYMKEYPDLKILYQKNGFVFTKREPK